MDYNLQFVLRNNHSDFNSTKPRSSYQKQHIHDCIFYHHIFAIIH